MAFVCSHVFFIRSSLCVRHHYASEYVKIVINTTQTSVTFSSPLRQHPNPSTITTYKTLFNIDTPSYRYANFIPHSTHCLLMLYRDH